MYMYTWKGMKSSSLRKFVRTFQTLNEFLVFCRILDLHAEAFRRNVQHSLAVDLPARVSQTGEEAVQLRQEVVLNTVGPRLIVEEDGRVHAVHHAQQALNVAR